MPRKISGTKSETARIMILKESDWSIESNTVVSGSGAYSIEDLESGKKTALAITTEDEVIAYGNISPQNTGDAKLWGWGWNGGGELGLGHTSPYRFSSPVQVGALEDWDWEGGVVVGKDNTLAVKIDGTLWSWGVNGYGELAQGDTINRSSPTQVGSDTNWSKAATSGYHTLIVKTDGTLWSCGRNLPNGELGLGDQINRSSPVQIGSDTDWSTAACGTACSLALKTDGKLYAWGDNAYGQLGLGDRIDRSSPVQVGALTDWSSVDAGQRHIGAIKTDGTLWTWGYNNHGQLGQENLTRYSSPVQVGGLSNWSQVSCGSFYHIAATKTDGTLWTWGYNLIGQLGHGDLIKRSSPVQVGLLDDWSSVSAGFRHTAATKTDGTLWAWGFNDAGQLGQNNIIDYSSPVQVGLLTTWNGVDCGVHTLGLE